MFDFGGYILRRPLRKPVMEGKNFEKFHYLVIQLLHEVAAAKSKEEIRL